MLLFSGSVYHLRSSAHGRIGLKMNKFTLFKFSFIFSFFKKYLFIFREKGKKGEREGEKLLCGRHTSIRCLSHTPNWGVLAYNPGLCPDWELNQRPFGSQAGIQSTEPYHPGQTYIFFLFGTTHTNLLDAMVVVVQFKQ